MKHGLSKTRIYTIYSAMKQRCYNQNHPHYKWYGAKGITICDEWMGENGFQNFVGWSLSNGYNEDLTVDRIDRIDPGSNYCPDNCQWLNPGQNAYKCRVDALLDVSNIDYKPVSLDVIDKICDAATYQPRDIIEHVSSNDNIE